MVRGLSVRRRRSYDPGYQQKLLTGCRRPRSGSFVTAAGGPVSRAGDPGPPPAGRPEPPDVHGRPRHSVPETTAATEGPLMPAPARRSTTGRPAGPPRREHR
ncbi:hypothetical protein GCM10010495_75600 [Kitasatospora herbaricolor]|nr:hypothetical protein GCM10010495_75600 [Kitasatospora herbaricolor]